MRKDKPYMRKTGRSLSRGLCLAVLCLLFLSCADDAVLPDTGGTCTATLQLNVSSFGKQESDGITRSVAGNSDEDRVKDLWVFQFNADTIGSLLKNPEYISEKQLDGNVDEIEITFEQNRTGESSVVCVVANTHDENWAMDVDGVRAGFGTYAEFLKQKLPVEVSEPVLSLKLGATGGYTIPMYGESAQTVITGKTYLRVPLVRMFARVHVLVDPSYPIAHHMKIKSITYSNVPLYSRVKEITKKDEYPADVEWKEYVEEGANDFILYIPENRQGVEKGISDKSTADPALFPENAFALKVDMTHASMSEGSGEDTHVHEYTVYPGGDMKNDFNIRRNYIYNVSIKLISEPDKDTIVP